MFNGLWQSRKFRVLVIDMVTSLTLYFVSKYVAWLADDMIFLIGAIQPVFLCMIGGIAYEDGQAKRIGAHPVQLEARAANSDAQVMSSPNDYAAAVGAPESVWMEPDPVTQDLAGDIAGALGI